MGMWMVRAGQGGFLADEFLTLGFVALGLGHIGNLAAFPTREAILERIGIDAPGAARRSIMNSASQLLRFRDDLHIGDQVLTYSPRRRTYHIGKIASDYIFDGTEPREYKNKRNVLWNASFNRDHLSLASRNSLTSMLPLFKIPVDAEGEIQSLLESSQR